MGNTLLDTLDAGKQRQIANVREAAGRIWKIPLHRYYTDHTVEHSERVIALLDGLTAGMMMGRMDKRLAPGEVFTLLAAAYLHDIGMQDERYAAGDLDEIRSDHHELSAELIYRAVQDPRQAVNLGLPNDPGLVEAVALVTRGHRKVDLRAAEYNPLVHGGETLRLRLLAALLRFGDELDIDHRRVDLELIKLMKLPPDSQLHWWKCHYVSGVSVEDEYIKIAYRFPQARPDYETFIIPLVENDIRNKLGELEEIFRANAVKVAVAKSPVRLMRLVEKMPAEVEALARERRGDGETRRVGDEETRSLFDMRGQTVDTQVNVAGDYVVGGAVTPAAGSAGAGVRSAVVRELILAAFDDCELTTLCFDYFRPVYEQFAGGMSKPDKVQRLIEHCERRNQLEVLLKRVEQLNPAQYARFAARLV